MLARIYKPAPSAMQSGKANAKEWVLEFDSEAARGVEPLMGWISSSDTRTQVRIAFDTREEAIAFAQRQGLPFQVTEPRPVKRIVKAYADNFAANRKRPWTH
jgi:hypothetical protein